MIEQAKKVIEAIKNIEKEEAQEELTKCAIAVSEIAFTSFKGGLRRKALDIASALVDFEDELIQTLHNKHSKAITA